MQPRERDTTGKFDRTDYSVAVKNRGHQPNPWKWEIYRAGRSSPSRFPNFQKALAKQIPRRERRTGQQGKKQRVGYGAANDPVCCSKNPMGHDQGEDSDHEPELHDHPLIHQQA